MVEFGKEATGTIPLQCEHFVAQAGHRFLELLTETGVRKMPQKWRSSAAFLRQFKNDNRLANEKR